MRYLISVIDDTTNSATAAEMEAIDAFNARLVADGHWVLACGLGSPATASVIDNRGDTPVSSDGPFVATEEYVSGFWIIDVADREIAVLLAAEGSRCCNRKVELRPFLGG
jgi:hypothetical protein